MNYDLEILVPLSNKSHFARRVKDFKTFGVLNSGDWKVLVKVLVGKEAIPDIEDGWPPNVDVEIIRAKEDHPAHRVYGYYSTVDADSLQAKWYMRVDDDGYTNISSLMNCLSKVDFKDKHYFATFMHPLWENVIERSLLLNMGYDEEDFIDKIRHEHECCVMSLASLQNVLRCKKAIELFKKRSKILDEVCDRCFGCGAYIAGEKIKEVPWLSREFTVSDFSYLGGAVHHIHELCYDKHPLMFMIFSELVRRRSESKDEIETSVLSLHQTECKNISNIVVLLHGLEATVRFSTSKLSRQDHDEVSLLHAINVCSAMKRNFEMIRMWAKIDDNIYFCDERGYTIMCLDLTNLVATTNNDFIIFKAKILNPVRLV